MKSSIIEKKRDNLTFTKAFFLIVSSILLLLLGLTLYSTLEKLFIDDLDIIYEKVTWEKDII